MFRYKTCIVRNDCQNKMNWKRIFRSLNVSTIKVQCARILKALKARTLYRPVFWRKTIHVKEPEKVWFFGKDVLTSGFYISNFLKQLFCSCVSILQLCQSCVSILQLCQYFTVVLVFCIGCALDSGYFVHPGRNGTKMSKFEWTDSLTLLEVTVL